MRYLMIFALLVFPTAIARSQEPDARPTIDEQVAKLVALKQQQADLKKQEEAVAADLKKRFDELRELLDKLGVIDPKPPKPPEPKPPEPKPEPVDPLVVKLAAAFAADPPTSLETKREYAKLLAALYRAAEKLTRNESVGTSGELLTQVSRAAADLLEDPPGMKKLAGTRKVVNAELTALLPTDEPLTADQRANVAALFKKLAMVLDTF